jgi:hypothetical protein
MDIWFSSEVPVWSYRGGNTPVIKTFFIVGPVYHRGHQHQLVVKWGDHGKSTVIIILPGVRRELMRHIPREKAIEEFWWAGITALVRFAMLPKYTRNDPRENKIYHATRIYMNTLTRAVYLIDNQMSKCYHRRKRAKMVIAKYVRTAMSDPNYRLCRWRLLRKAGSLNRL